MNSFYRTNTAKTFTCAANNTDAVDLATFISDNVGRNDIVYITDADGNRLNHAAIRKTRLTDGSYVYDLVLSSTPDRV
jgi:hypothetical protein